MHAELQHPTFVPVSLKCARAQPKDNLGNVIPSAHSTFSFIVKTKKRIKRKGETLDRDHNPHMYNQKEGS